MLHRCSRMSASRSAFSAWRSARISRAPSRAALASLIEASGLRYCAASAAGSQAGSARMASASGSRPASRAIWARVRRLGL
ncbi:Uncharacterised protein [Bordetella pertussis]|nr:Uncharacterised protein [Bordetella pertussis]CFP69204.1 Uncharacterised protein [Bordetella pertussis]CFW39173.1 Uncharacterised protein [Bordetella pertussis]